MPVPLESQAPKRTPFAISDHPDRDAERRRGPTGQCVPVGRSERVAGDRRAAWPTTVRRARTLRHAPAGLIPRLKEIGVPVIWRCHVGIDHPSVLSRRAWSFLRPYVEPADAYVFSREAFIWDGLERAWIELIALVIDARIGGIQDQIIDRRSGILLDEPAELGPYGDAVRGLLEEPERARAIGQEAQQRVRDHFLAARSLMQYLDLIGRLLN
jgi:hypothetical protein